LCKAMSVEEELQFARVEDRGYYWCLVDKTLEYEPVVEPMMELGPDFSLGVLPEGVMMDVCRRDGKPAVQRWYFPKYAYDLKLILRKAQGLDQSYRQRMRGRGIDV